MVKEAYALGHFQGLGDTLYFGKMSTHSHVISLEPADGHSDRRCPPTTDDVWTWGNSTKRPSSTHRNQTCGARPAGCTQSPRGTCCLHLPHISGRSIPSTFWQYVLRALKMFTPINLVIPFWAIYQMELAYN